MANGFSTKDPDEVIVVSFDFSKLLDPDETITACTFSILDTANNTAVTGMLSDDPDISGAPIVKQRIEGGVHKHDYMVKAKIETSQDRVLVGSAQLPVRIGA